MMNPIGSSPFERRALAPAVHRSAPTRPERVALATLTLLQGAVAATALAAGSAAQSWALMAEGLHAFGTALVLGLVIGLGRTGHGPRAVAALGAGLVMSAAGLALLGGTVRGILHWGAPQPVFMAAAALALVALHLAGLVVLRSAGLDRSALWRSTLIGAAVSCLLVLAALAAAAIGTDWPDSILAANRAALILIASFRLAIEGFEEWRTGEDRDALDLHSWLGETSDETR